ncbi:MAG: CpaF family protein [Bdellovibrio sp.]|nr:CpaF family protein [Bdellovibrio sp.]
MQSQFEDNETKTIIELKASWPTPTGEKHITLERGKHFVGSGPHCALSLSQSETSICAILLVNSMSIHLKCIAIHPTLYVRGNKLRPGETVIIDEECKIFLGKTKIILSPQIAGASDNFEISKGREDNPLWFIKNDPTLLVQDLSKRLQSDLDLSHYDISQLESEELKIKVSLKLGKMLFSLKFPADFPQTAQEIRKRVLDEVLGLGPLEDLLADSAISEIMVNSKDQIYVEKHGKLTLSSVTFSTDLALLNVIERIVSQVGRRIDSSSPIVDARLLDGSRVNAVIPPLALKGPNLTIRRFSKIPITMEKLVEYESLNRHMAFFLKTLVESHKNIIISGGTGSGKTTLLNAISNFIPSGERIITVEDAAELQLQQEHVISLETRPANMEGKGSVNIRDLIRNTLRMRPDRIIVGECRGGEALDMLQAMNTGHDGSMTTAHANTPLDMLRRLETMVMMAGMELPLPAIREQVASAITFVIQQTRRKNGKRLVMDVSYVSDLDRQTGEYKLVLLFSRDKNDQVVFHAENFQSVWEQENLCGDINLFYQ